MEKVAIYISREKDRENDKIIVEDLLRDQSQFSSFESLVGFTIKHVSYDQDGDVVLDLDLDHNLDRPKTIMLKKVKPIMKNFKESNYGITR